MWGVWGVWGVCGACVRAVHQPNSRSIWFASRHDPPIRIPYPSDAPVVGSPPPPSAEKVLRSSLPPSASHHNPTGSTKPKRAKAAKGSDGLAVATDPTALPADVALGPVIRIGPSFRDPASKRMRFGCRWCKLVTDRRGKRVSHEMSSHGAHFAASGGPAEGMSERRRGLVSVYMFESL